MAFPKSLLILMVTITLGCENNDTPFEGKRITCLFVSIDSNPSHYPFEIFLGQQKLGVISAPSNSNQTCLRVMEENGYTVSTTNQAARIILAPGVYKFSFKNNLGATGSWQDFELTSGFECFTITD